MSVAQEAGLLALPPERTDEKRKMRTRLIVSIILGVVAVWFSIVYLIPIVEALEQFGS